MSARRALAVCATVAMTVAVSACAARRISLPTDPGTPLSDFATIHAQLSESCRGVRTLRGVLGLSGRAGDQRLSGRVIAGFERPSSMRLEAVAPFGQPLFYLAARDGAATLLFPRESRILRDASPAAILGALTGVALAPADLQAVLTGCVVPLPRATGGRVHANGMASIDIEGADEAAASGAGRSTATLFLERNGSGWRIRAARRAAWQIDYAEWPGTFPQSVRLVADGPDARVDLTAAISELETNVDIDPAAFTVDDAGASPMTLEELRQMGPLRGN